jgi:hypothetical protein
MEDTKTPLPTLLPWAATACLAALVACVGELLIIEKARTRLLNEQNLLSEAALKGAENQLEAERILDRREHEAFGKAGAAGPEFRVLLLSGPLPGSSGAIVLDPDTNVCLVRAALAPEAHPPGDFQLWLLGPGPGYPADCGTFHAFPQGESGVRLRLPRPYASGCDFVLVFGAAGGARTYPEAISRGIIELATRAPPGKITD